MAAGTINHEDLGATEAHVPHAWVYANDAARTGATGLVAGDDGKIAYQSDTAEYWRLDDYSGPTWVIVAPKTFDDILERTAGSGVTIDVAVKIKDGDVILDEGGTTTTLTGTAASSGKTITFPNATGTVPLLDDAVVLTNKSIDSDNNTITNIVNADIKAAAGIVTSKLADGTVLGTKGAEIVCVNYTSDVTVADGKGYLHIPASFNGMNLVTVHAEVITAGTTGTTDIQIHNVTDAVDMLSTKITIDSTETGSDTAATPAVIDATKDDVATNDLLRIDVDAVSTTKPKGLIVTLEFRLP